MIPTSSFDRTDNKPSRILALGGGGFIGAHLTERLLREGHEVVSVDIHSDKLTNSLQHPRLTFIEKNIRDASLDLGRLTRESDLVIDLVAYANPGLYVKMPLEVFRLNFMDNLRIVEACVEHGKRLIQFSSSEVYGKTVVSVVGDKLEDPDSPEYATFHEDESAFILGPVGKHRWIYSCAKQLLERVLHAYGLEDQLNYTVIRPFNFIGPKIDYLPSEDDQGIPRVFSHFMESLLTGKPLQLVDGGTHRRSYTYILDAIDCIYRIVENPDGVCDREVFNIGTLGNEVSIRELAIAMRDVYNDRFFRPGDRVPELVDISSEEFYGEGYEDSDRRIPDLRKAQELLGYEPRYDLRTMLELSIGYYVDRWRAAS
jgi:UDP-apiose/xylose synthase